MRPSNLFLFTLVICVLGPILAFTARADAPSWIWGSQHAFHNAAAGECEFKKSFEIDRTIKSAIYEIHTEGNKVLSATAVELAAGVEINGGPDLQQASSLRDTIRRKNELFFHRWRPQNETYLFLFRKHEQGNNAIEIPQFDPLVSEQEAKIARLRVPVAHRYEVTRSQ